MSVRLRDWFATSASLNSRVVLSVIVKSDEELRPSAAFNQGRLRGVPPAPGSRP